VPRRKRFGQKSRELYNELNQSQKELKNGSANAHQAPKSGSNEDGPPEKPSKIDRLV
jgi:hypothetical protein